MNTALFLQQLALNLGDPSNVTYSAALNQASMCLAVRAYARWRPLLRSFGTGVIYSNATAGDDSIQVVGGTFAVGQQLQIVDMFGMESPFTITGMSVGTPIENWMGVPIQLTLSRNLAYNHAAGVFVGLSNPGLPIVQGLQYYPLPPDFVQFDQLTWDLANGQRFYVENFVSFYDGVYLYSELLDGRGYGNTQTYQSSSGGWPLVGGGAFIGIPDGTGFNPPGQATFQTVLEVQPGNPPLLYMNPPQQQAALWQFNYYATHQPETVPDADFDAVMDAARAVATEAQWQILAGLMDLRDIRQDMKPSANANAMMAVAEQAMKQFDIKVRKRPFMVTG